MIRHGHTSVQRNGAKRISGEWTSWKAMWDRCADPDKPIYFGLPIDPSWASFDNFIADMGLKPTPGHTIDRIDGSLGYFPSNCRWASKEEQGSNRRDNVFPGRSVAVAARELGISKIHAFRKRIEKRIPWDDLVPEENRHLIDKLEARQ